jgi:hypothetical protein
MYNVTLGRVRVTMLPWKISITYSECVSVALVIQHAMRMGRIILLCVLFGSTIFINIIS